MSQVQNSHAGAERAAQVSQNTNKPQDLSGTSHAVRQTYFANGGK